MRVHASPSRGSPDGHSVSREIWIAADVSTVRHALLLGDTLTRAKPALGGITQSPPVLRATPYREPCHLLTGTHYGDRKGSIGRW